MLSDIDSISVCNVCNECDVWGILYRNM